MASMDYIRWGCSVHRQLSSVNRFRMDDEEALKARSGSSKDDTKRHKIMDMLNFTPDKFEEMPSLHDILTPPSKGDNHAFCDTPLSGEHAVIETDLNGSYTGIYGRPLGRFHSFDVKRSLFSAKRPLNTFTVKRPLDDSDVNMDSPVTKKLRDTESALGAFSLESPLATEKVDNVKTVVQRLATDDTLVADGTRPYILPTVAGKHQDLKAISADTMKDVLDGCYDNQIDHVTVIDCRYPYEYDGGHINDAINLYTQDSVLNFLHQHGCARTPGKHVLVFHCEFSSERGPKMYRFLRSQDRVMNKEQYPALYFPEVYLLEGGYKAFFHTQKNHCFPPTYMPMNHKNYSTQLRHFRGKSKSWTAGERVQMPRFSLKF